MNALPGIVGVLLAASALAKLLSPRRSARALGWALHPGAARVPAMFALVAVELALAAGLVLAAVGRAPLVPIAIATAVLLLGGALLLGIAVIDGRAGEPCGCFGARGRIGWPAVARNLLLAGAVLAPLVPARTDAWLGVGVGVALLAAAALATALLALAREVGELRLVAGGDVALEIAEEGPPLGRVVPEWPGESFARGRAGALQLAVFTSEGCAMCARLAPAIDHVARDQALAVVRFDEVEDAAVWRALGVPGSPFVVVAEGDGTALAKGTFNSLAQLESVIAAAARRREGRGGGVAAAA